MGIYKNKVTDFIQRTLELVEQYETIKSGFAFDEQYNHTLLINCLLGLIVLPKEKAISHISIKRMVVIKREFGLEKSTFHESIKTIKDLVKELRDSTAHFNIEFRSIEESGFIDLIEFKNDEKEIIIATFYKDELLLFVKLYGQLLLRQLSVYYSLNQ